MRDVPGCGAIARRAVAVLAFVVACAAMPAAVLAQESAQQSPLAPADAPPPGLAPQLSFFGIGAGFDECTITPLDRAGTAPLSSECMWEVGTSNQFGFQDFDPNQDLLVQITRPDGKVEGGNLGTERSFTWASMPDEPTGLYTVVAAQSGRIGSGAFAIGPASEPRFVYTPETGPAGTEFRIGLTGFAPDQQVRLHVYRSIYPAGGNRGGNVLYLTTLGPIQTDRSGQAIYTVHTSSGDRPGYYLLKTEPAATGPFPVTNGFRLNAGPGSAPATLDQEREILVRAMVEEADREWAAVVAGNGADPATFDNIFGGALLDQMRSDAQALRAAGQHVEARLTSPVVVLKASGPEDPLAPGFPGPRAEAVVQEQWSIRRLNADGSVASAQSGPVTHRYVLEQDPDIYLWRIVEAEALP